MKQEVLCKYSVELALFFQLHRFFSPKIPITLPSSYHLLALPGIFLSWYCSLYFHTILVRPTHSLTQILILLAILTPLIASPARTFDRHFHPKHSLFSLRFMEACFNCSSLISLWPPQITGRA